MSDIACARCKEPRDTYHMRHDAIHEVVPYEKRALAKAWDGKLESKIGNDTARQWLADDKGVFGSSLYDIRRCPCCPEGAKPVTSEERDELVALMAGDEDGIASMLEDMQ